MWILYIANPFIECGTVQNSLSQDGWTANFTFGINWMIHLFASGQQSGGNMVNNALLYWT